MENTHNVTIVEGDKSNFIAPVKMRIGEIGVIRQHQSGYEGAVVLKTYAGLVALNNPSHTWETVCLKQCLFKIELLPPGTLVTILVPTVPPTEGSDASLGG